MALTTVATALHTLPSNIVILLHRDPSASLIVISHTLSQSSAISSKASSLSLQCRSSKSTSICCNKPKQKLEGLIIQNRPLALDWSSQLTTRTLRRSRWSCRTRRASTNPRRRRVLRTRARTSLANCRTCSWTNARSLTSPGPKTRSSPNSSTASSKSATTSPTPTLASKHTPSAPWATLRPGSLAIPRTQSPSMAATPASHACLAARARASQQGRPTRAYRMIALRPTSWTKAIRRCTFLLWLTRVSHTLTLT